MIASSIHRKSPSGVGHFTHRRVPRSLPSRQQGVVLWVSLFVLLIMMATTIGVLRGSFGGMSIAGNLGFRKSATSDADLGIEQARAWILGNTASLQADNAGTGFYSTWVNNTFNPGQFNWAPGVTSAAAINPNAGQTGNAVQYVIHRMCQLPGATSGNVTVAGGGQAPQVCVSPASGEDDGPSEGFQMPGTVRPMYRITVRVEGPRSTVSFVQGMVF